MTSDNEEGRELNAQFIAGEIDMNQRIAALKSHHNLPIG